MDQGRGSEMNSPQGGGKKPWYAGTGFVGVTGKGRQKTRGTPGVSREKAVTSGYG